MRSTPDATVGESVAHVCVCMYMGHVLSSTASSNCS